MSISRDKAMSLVSLANSSNHSPFFKRKVGIDLDCEEIHVGQEVKVLFIAQYETKRLFTGTVVAFLSDSLEHKIKLNDGSIHTMFLPLEPEVHFMLQNKDQFRGATQSGLKRLLDICLSKLHSLNEASKSNQPSKRARMSKKVKDNLGQDIKSVFDLIRVIQQKIDEISEIRDPMEIGGLAPLVQDAAPAATSSLMTSGEKAKTLRGYDKLREDQWQEAGLADDVPIQPASDAPPMHPPLHPSPPLSVPDEGHINPLLDIVPEVAGRNGLPPSSLGPNGESVAEEMLPSRTDRPDPFKEIPSSSRRHDELAPDANVSKAPKKPKAPKEAPPLLAPPQANARSSRPHSSHKDEEEYMSKLRLFIEGLGGVLDNNWTVEVRRRKDNSSGPFADVVYFHGGEKFRSKLDVARHLGLMASIPKPASSTQGPMGTGRGPGSGPRRPPQGLSEVRLSTGRVNRAATLPPPLSSRPLPLPPRPPPPPPAPPPPPPPASAPVTAVQTGPSDQMDPKKRPREPKKVVRGEAIPDDGQKGQAQRVTRVDLDAQLIPAPLPVTEEDMGMDEEGRRLTAQYREFTRSAKQYGHFWEFDLGHVSIDDPVGGSEPGPSSSAQAPSFSLVGREVKILWDYTWYQGTVRERLSGGKHRVEYKQKGEVEDIHLSGESVRVYMHPGEVLPKADVPRVIACSKEIEAVAREQRGKSKGQNGEDGGIDADAYEGKALRLQTWVESQSRMKTVSSYQYHGPGSVIWLKYSCWRWWPCIIVTLDHLRRKQAGGQLSRAVTSPFDTTRVPLYFFGDHTCLFQPLDSQGIQSCGFEEGLRHGLHHRRKTKKKKSAADYERALEELAAYFRRGVLPESFISVDYPYLEESDLDDEEEEEAAEAEEPEAKKARKEKVPSKPGKTPSQPTKPGSSAAAAVRKASKVIVPFIDPWATLDWRAIASSAALQKLPDGIVAQRQPGLIDMVVPECQVCGDEDEVCGDYMLQCDGCRCCIHMGCIGEKKEPDGSLWLCTLCKVEMAAREMYDEGRLSFPASSALQPFTQQSFAQQPSAQQPGSSSRHSEGDAEDKTRPPFHWEPPACVLCPVVQKGLPMIPCKDGKRWCHVTCAHIVPEIRFDFDDQSDEGEGMRGGSDGSRGVMRVVNVDETIEMRKNLKCSLCNQHYGACIQCEGPVKGKCFKAFHVLCAREHGLSIASALEKDVLAVKGKGLKNPLQQKAKAVREEGVQEERVDLDRSHPLPRKDRGTSTDNQDAHYSLKDQELPPHGNEELSGVRQATRGAAGPLKIQKACLECGATESKGWDMGPKGSGTLCRKCGWQYYKTRKDLPKSEKAKKNVPREKKREEEMPQQEEEGEEDGTIVLRCFCHDHRQVALSFPWRPVHTQLQQPRAAGGPSSGALFKDKAPAKPSKALSKAKVLPGPPLPLLAPPASSYDAAPVSVMIKHNYGSARCIPLGSTLRREIPDRGPREPETLQRALDKRIYVECTPYLTSRSGLVRNLPLLPVVPSRVRHSNDPADLLGSTDGKLVRSVSERYHAMREGHRRGHLVTCGKSAIHGQGAMAKKRFEPGEMVIEYAGDLIRPSVADARERAVYNRMVGAGTYIFRLNEEHCIDATRAGNMAHLLNHSCEPNCISRTVFVGHGEGRVEEHVVIFAKFKIEAGAELTYDYRFNGEEVLVCNCGAGRCRGKVNLPEREERDEDKSIRVPRSQVEEIGMELDM